MKKSGILCNIVISIGLLLTGCGNSFDHMPNLTEEESALIAEYTAGILLKHDQNAGKLASDTEIIAADERAAVMQANTEAFLAASAGENGEEGEQEDGSADDGSAAAVPEQTAAAAFEGIAEFCGVEGFRIEYAGHVVSDSYPPAEGADMVFSMDATEGTKLLVLKFIAENVTSEDRELDMLSQDIRFGISVNNGPEKNALSTLLLDDFSSFKGVIPAQSSVVVVLTSEIGLEEADTISSISLSMQSVSGSATTLLE